MEYNKLKIKETNFVEIDKSKLIEVPNDSIKEESGYVLIDSRGDFEFRERAFYLGEKFDWVIGKDSNNMLCLVPMKKR